MIRFKRANVDWMKGSFGAGFHWTSTACPLSGARLPYAEAVEKFNLQRFVDTLCRIGAKHCIFTTSHAEQYLPFPHPLLDAILPGRTTQRDLIGEMLESFEKHGIKLILYYNHACNGEEDPAWRRACGYHDGNLDLFAARICMIVELVSRRYGKKLAGWWFDSSYSIDPRGPYNTVTTELSDWRFPWEALAEAVKSGNPDSAVTFNAGVKYHRFLYSMHQDYYAGETTKLDENYGNADLIMKDHRWLCIDNANWVHSPENTPFSKPLFGDEELRKFILGHTGNGKMVSLNIEIDQTGEINPNSVDQILRIHAK